MEAAVDAAFFAFHMISAEMNQSVGLSSLI